MAVDITALSIEVKSTGISQAASALGGLSTSAANTEKHINSLIAAMQRLQTVSSTQSITANSTSALTAALNTLNNTLTQLNQRTTQASQSQRQHNDSMREANGLARGLSGALGALWMTYGAFAGMAVGVAIGASLREITKLGMEVEKQLNFVFALSKDNQAVDLGSFLKITESSVQSITDAANAMRALAQNGLSVTDSLSALPSILNLATVGEMNVGQAAIAATGAVSAFGLEISDMERVTDIFAKTAATSNTSVIAMTESMKQASTAASLFHVSIEETAAMLGLLAKINITGGAAGTSFTNMLTGLYEPTEQAKKAMEKLGVSAFDSTGKMKNVTVLLEDIKRSASSLSDQAKADIFGDMVTARGMKSLILATDNLDSFKQKTKESAEALGFMKDVVAKLEDDSAHAFTRMGVIIQSEFVRAFMNAAPEVQKLGQALGDMFKSSGAERKNTITGEIEKETTAIANLFKNLVIAANFLVEHVKLVASAVAVYTLWKVAIGYTVVQQTALGVSTATLGGLYGTWRAAVLASAAAQALAITTSIAHTTAHAAGASTVALFTAATEANTAAALANTAAQRTMLAFLLPALAALAIAVAAGAALWLMFSDNTDDATDANTKMSNSIHVIKEQLDKEIDRLERSLELWDERKKRFNDPTSVSPQKIDAAQDIVNKLEEQITRATGLTKTDLSAPDSAYRFADANMQLATAYITAKDNLKLLQDLQGKSVKAVSDKGIEATIKDFDKLREQVEKYKEEASQVGSKGKKDYLIANPAERALRESAKEILNLMDKINMSKTMGKEQIEGASKLISQARVDFMKLQEAVNKTKTPLTKDEDRPDTTARYNAALEEVQSRIDSVKRQLRYAEEDLQSKYKQGIIGEISLIKQKEAAEVDAAKNTIELLNEKLSKAAGPAKGGVIEEIKSAKKARVEIEAEAHKKSINAESEYYSDLKARSDKFEGEAFDAKKEYANAYTAYKSAQHKKEIKRLTDNVALEVGTIHEGESKKLLVLQQAAFDAGLIRAQNQDAEKNFNIAADATRNAIKGVQTASEGQGLVAMFDAATAASKRYTADLITLEALRDKITDPKGKEEAQARITQGAEDVRKLWLSVGDSISKSLESAFGKGGKAAGDLLKIGSDYNKLTVKDGAARIKSYGDAAGAAKGFFKENSTGYKIMETAEKAFRALELAGMVMSLATTGSTEAAKNAIKTPGALLSFMSSMPAWAWAGAGLAVAAVLSGGGGSGPSSSESRQKSQGTGSVLGSSDAKSESIARSLSIMEKNSGLGLAQGSSMVNYLRIVSDGIQGLAGIVVGRTSNITTGPLESISKGFFGKIGNSIFGGDKTTLDTGISSNKMSLSGVLNGGLKANQYADTKKDGGWFRSDKYASDIKALGAETNDQFSKIVVNMAQSITQASKALGLSGDGFAQKLESFVVDIGKISLKGMSGEEVQKALEAVFSKLGDDMARFAIVGLDKFQKVGEGYLETVVRLANDLMQVKDVFAVLDKTFALTGIAAITVSESLIAAAGGLEKLTEGTKFFVDNFLTEAEKMGPITNSVAKRLKELNISEVTSIDLFKKKVRALDLTNAADQALYAAMLELAPAFKEVADYSDKLAEGTIELTKAQKAALDGVHKARSNLENAYKAESSALQSTIDKTKTYVQTLKDFQNSLKLGANSPLTNQQKYAEARSQFNAVSLAAKGGDAAAQQKFTSIANEFLNASKIINASGAGYTADFTAVQDMTTSLVDAAVTQVDVATASLNALNAQVAGLITIDQSVMSVTQAITELRLAVEAGKTSGLNNAQMGVVDPAGTAPSTATTSTNLLVEAIAKLAQEVADLKGSGGTTTGAIIGAIYGAAEANAETIVDGVVSTGGGGGGGSRNGVKLNLV